MRLLRVAFATVVLVTVLLVAAPARAESLPRPDPYSDAPNVALIVEARVVEGDRVAITATLSSGKPLGAGARDLQVQSLSALSRRVDIFDAGDGAGQVLESKEAVLLLDFDDAASSWKPLNTFVSKDFSGSCGVYWLRDGKVWCYEQTHNPGPLTLRPWRPDGRTQGTLEQLRREIADGLVAERAWRADAAEPDPAERAWKLARWLRKATSPDGEHLTRRRFQVRDELKQLGPVAVPPLVEVLSVTDDEQALEQAICALADLGPQAKDAVPRLVELAAKPGATAAHTLAFAMRAIADERTAPALRKMFDDARLTDDLVLDYTADALVKMKDAGAADRLAKKLPPSLEGFTSVSGILVVLRHLHRLEHRRAQLWLKPRASHSLFDEHRDEVTRILTTRSNGSKFDPR